MYYFNDNLQPKIVLADCRIGEETAQSLKAPGIFVVPSYKSSRILPAVSAHPDMTFLCIGENKAVCSPDSYEYYKAALPELALDRGEVGLEKAYPLDVAYNITVLENHIFANLKSPQSEILKKYRADFGAKKIINVKQGYTKCSICVVGGSAIITEDTGIYAAAKENGIDALLIRGGYVELPGMSCGFFGGACGLIDKHTLLVNGDISTHPDCDRIRDFCKNRSVEIISLKRGKITDIGSIIAFP